MNGREVLEKLQEASHSGYGLKVMVAGEFYDIRDVMVCDSDDPDVEPAVVIRLEE